MKEQTLAQIEYLKKKSEDVRKQNDSL